MRISEDEKRNRTQFVAALKKDGAMQAELPAERDRRCLLLLDEKQGKLDGSNEGHNFKGFLSRFFLGKETLLTIAKQEFGKGFFVETRVNIRNYDNAKTQQKIDEAKDSVALKTAGATSLVFAVVGGVSGGMLASAFIGAGAVTGIAIAGVFGGLIIGAIFGLIDGLVTSSSGISRVNNNARTLGKEYGREKIEETNEKIREEEERKERGEEVVKESPQADAPADPGKMAKMIEEMRKKAAEQGDSGLGGPG